MRGEDLFAGQAGLQRLLRERKQLHAWFNKELHDVCERLGLRLLRAPGNKISTAIDLSTLEQECPVDELHLQQPLGEQEEGLRQQEHRHPQHRQTQQRGNETDAAPKYSQTEDRWKQQQQNLLERACEQQQQAQQTSSKEVQQAEHPRARAMAPRPQQAYGAESVTKQPLNADIRHLGSFLFRRRCSGLRVVCCRSTTSSLRISHLFSSKREMSLAHQQGQQATKEQSSDDCDKQKQVEDGRSMILASNCDSLLLPLQHACASHFPSFSPQGLQYLRMILKQETPRSGMSDSRLAGATGATATIAHVTGSYLAPQVLSNPAFIMPASSAKRPHPSKHFTTGTSTEDAVSAAAVRPRLGRASTVGDATAGAFNTDAFKIPEPIIGVHCATGSSSADGNVPYAEEIIVVSSVTPTVSSTQAAAARSSANTMGSAQRGTGSDCAAASSDDALSTGTSFAPAAGGVQGKGPSSVIAAGRQDAAALPLQKNINGHTLSNWGSHCENYPVSYCTVAVAIGATKAELETFLRRFKLAVRDVRKRQSQTSSSCGE